MQSSNDTRGVIVADRILHWGGLPKRIWITTEYDLDIGEIYYFPRYAFDEETTKKQ